LKKDTSRVISGEIVNEIDFPHIGVRVPPANQWWYMFLSETLTAIKDISVKSG